MSIDMNNIVWAWSPKERCKGETIKRNGKGSEAIEAQREEVEQNGEIESDINE